MEEERKNKSKWLPIAPDGEIPNSVIRLIMTQAQNASVKEPTLHFKDIAMLIAKVRSTFIYQNAAKHGLLANNFYSRPWPMVLVCLVLDKQGC